jgi:hypothetical protein
MLIAAGAIVAATLAAAFMTMDSPGQVRDRKLDQRRVRELDEIADAIERWQGEHDEWPASLAELAAQPGVSLAVRDPVSGAAYGYEAGTGSKYRLCAVFATDTAKRDPQRDMFGYFDQRWAHPAGRYCFDREVEAPQKASAGP